MRTLSILLLLSFTIVSGIYSQDEKKAPYERLAASEEAHQLQNSVGAPDVNAGELINLNESGDVSFSIPVYTVRGRKLSFPITANYQAGIKVDQKASEIGLGWSINFGSIVRDYGAFEPDYAETSVEAKMAHINADGTESGLYGILDNPGGNGKPFSNNNKDLIYNNIDEAQGSDYQKMTPDLYRVTIPGKGSNTFWNNGNPNEPHDFVWNEFKAWDIDHEINNYEFPQELSAINELSYLNTFQEQPVDKLDNLGNVAAAICIPPYVKNRSFKRIVPENGVGSPPGSSSVKYDDFGSFSVVTEDGTQYIFGKALRGQKYLFSDDPFWSTLGCDPRYDDNCNLPDGAIYGEWWKIDFIVEWLLTEIRSVDYFDTNNNGRPDVEDEGDWIKIEYTTQQHREWLNFTQTDVASSLMRERAYVKKIITPIEELKFSISKQFDVDHDYFKIPLNNPDANQPYIYQNVEPPSWTGSNDPRYFHIHYPVETMRYDKVVIKERLKGGTYSDRDNVLSTVVFNYASKGSTEELAVSNYLIRNNQDQETVSYDPAVTGPYLDDEGNYLSGFNIENYYVSNGRGKTTLLGIDFFPGDDTNSADKQSFKFEYGFNPQFDKIHKFQIVKSNGFPNIRQSATSERTGNKNFVPTSLLNYSSIDVNLNCASVGSATYDCTPSKCLIPNIDPLNGIGIDEFGYYYEGGAQNNGRNAWSLSKITFPKGGSIELEYENDSFDYNPDLSVDSDRKKWNENGSLIDDKLPYISHYNNIAVLRSLIQGKVNSITNSDLKKLYRAYSMPLKVNSGGIRLKKKTSNDGINPVITTNYQYGKGHYPTVPASYWSNYIEGFSSFMQSERVRQESSSAYNLNVPLLIEGYYENDYSTFMTLLALNIRIDNTVSDDHYYEYIDEIRMENEASENNPFTRFHYGSKLTGDPFIHKQVNVAIKGEDRLLKPLIEAITNEVDRRHSIGLIKLEKYQAGTSMPYEKITYNYGSVQKDERKVSYSNASLGSYTYPVYDNLQGNGLMLYGIQTHSELLMSPIDDDNIYTSVNNSSPCSNSPGLNTQEYSEVVTSLNNNIINYLNDNNDYAVQAQTLRRHQSVHTTIQQTTTDYKGIITKKELTYDPFYGFLKEEKTTNSKIQINGNTIEPAIITEYQYGFEANNIGNLFTDKHLLSQVVKVKTRLENTPTQPAPTDVIKSSTQDFQNFNTNGLFPTSDYECNTPIISSGSNAGLMTNYVDFIFGAAPNAPFWEKRTHNRQYNHYGQVTFQQNNLLSIRNTYGYNSSVVKASFSLPGEEFDATYTGFEDLYDDDGSLGYWESKKDEFWYNQNIDRSFENNASYAYLYVWVANIEPPEENYPCGPYQLRVDNYDNSWQIGDPIVLKKNLDEEVNFTDGTIDFGQSQLPDFETTITDIVDVPVENFFQVGGWDEALVNYTDWNDFDHILCVSNPLPPEYQWHFGINVEKINEASEEAISKVTDDYAHSGNYSYLLSGLSESNNNPQKSPIRPVNIDPGFSSDYRASVWLRKRLYNPQIPGDIRFKYKVWNEDRTAVLDEGENIIDDATMQWKYYEMDIPLSASNSTTYLEVYVENHVEAFDLPENFGIVFIDDLLIYPEGAQYSYISFDKHLNPTHVTDINDKTVSTTYDEWGRTKKAYDANGALLQEFRYFTTDNIETKHNYIETTTWVGDQLYPFHNSREYLDGFGEIKQTVISESSENRRLVQSFDYDNLGRLHKTYNTLGEYGSGLSDKIVPDYASKLVSFYGANSVPYEELRYYSRPEAAIQASRNPSGNIGSVTFSTMDDGPDAWAEVTFYNISYPQNELLKQTVIDENGHPHHTFTNKFGQLIAQKEPIGKNYSFSGQGAISFDGSSTFETANTYYSYDAAGNLIKTVDPEGLATTMVYNSLGQLILETHPDKGRTGYVYDKYGRLRFSQDANDQEYNSDSPNNRFTYYKYDAWNRITEIGKLYITEASILWANDFALLNNPDFPDANTAGRQVHKQFEYDGDKEKNLMGRLLRERVFSDHQIDQGVYHNPQKTDVYTYEYDNNGNLSKKTFDLDGLNGLHEISYKYNWAGAVKERKYARESFPILDFYEVFEYDELGRLSKVKSGKSLNTLSVDAKYTYDALGKLKRKALAPAATGYNENIAYQYDIQNRLYNQVSEHFSNRLQYDKKGNINRQVWTNTQIDSPDIPFVQNQYDYYYDALDRLVGANFSRLRSNNNPFQGYDYHVIVSQYYPDFICSNNPAIGCQLNVTATSYASFVSLLQAPSIEPVPTYDVQYFYSKSGNLKRLKRYDQNGQYALQHYGYYSTANSATNKLRNVFLTNSAAPNTGWRLFQYDANGNATWHISTPSPYFFHKTTYNPFNMPVEIFEEVDEKTYRYRYDANDRRVAKELSQGIREYYLDGVVLSQFGTPKQYSISEGYVELSGFGIDKRYYIKDWLGTVRVVIDESGTVLNTRDHYPYGMLMPNRVYAGGNQEGRRYQFTGHEYDGGTGYGYHGARYYDREVGRYLGIDPMSNQRRGLSPYNYVRARTLNSIDPNGSLDYWVIGAEGKIKWDENAISEETTKPGEEYLGKEGYGIDEETGMAVHYYSDGTTSEFIQTLPGISIASYGAYLTSNPSISTNNRTGYIYNERDLEVRRTVLSSSSPISRAIRSLEYEGNYQILNATDYWATYGQNLGALIIFEQYLNMMNSVNTSLGPSRSTRGFGMSNRLVSPKNSFQQNLPKNPWNRFLHQNKGKYHGANWIQQARTDYLRMKAN